MRTIYIANLVATQNLDWER